MRTVAHPHVIMTLNLIEEQIESIDQLIDHTSILYLRETIYVHGSVLSMLSSLKLYDLGTETVEDGN
jgi:hypothetical protein